MVTKSSLLGALSLAFAAAACSTEVPVSPSTQTGPVLSADKGEVESESDDDAFSYAVIGDMPYGLAKRDSLPLLISLINGDPAVSRVIHIGDIKAGSKSDCSDIYFTDIRSQFDTFADPLVYTPGDNEWTDCHKAIKNNGLYTPTERLQKVRSLFFPVAGQTLGINAKKVTTQASDPANADYIENVRWTKGGVVFAAVNITGSYNDLAAWSVNPAVDMPANYLSFPTQAQEFAARAQANTAWINAAFDLATKRHAKGIVLAFQADMWDPVEVVKAPATFHAGFDVLVQLIGTRAAAFKGQVLLLHGDSHVWNVDYPFTPTSSLYGIYPTAPVATNVTRLVVDGSGSPTSYTRLTVNTEDGAQLFTLTRVPLVPGQ